MIRQVEDLILQVLVREIVPAQQNLLCAILAPLVLFLEVESICNGLKRFEVIDFCVVRRRHDRSIQGRSPARARVNARACWYRGRGRGLPLE